MGYIDRKPRRRDLKKRAKSGERHKGAGIPDGVAKKSPSHMCDPATCRRADCRASQEWRKNQR